MSPAANPFHNFGTPRPQKLKRGRRIKSIRQLAYVVTYKRCLWFSCKNGPVPCAIVQNWQLRLCMRYIDMATLYEVRR